jgi:hypothetical protein
MPHAIDIDPPARRPRARAEPEDREHTVDIDEEQRFVGSPA